MKQRVLAAAGLLCATGVLVSACGQQGALYLPDEKAATAIAPTTAPATSPEAAPAAAPATNATPPAEAAPAATDPSEANKPRTGNDPARNSEQR